MKSDYTHINKTERGIDMKGSIGTYEKCPTCQGKFEHIWGKGFLCKNCRTHPNRYYISAKALGIRKTKYSDRTGDVLDSYNRAFKELLAINEAWDQRDKKRYNPADWIAAEVVKQQFRHKAEELLAEYDIRHERGKISDSRYQSVNNLFNRFLIPYFDKKDIRDITEEDIKAFYYSLDKNYSDAYIKDVLALLKGILNRYASPAPRFPAHTVVPKMEKQWLGIERQMAIEPHLPEKYRLAIQVLQLGMRVGELRALHVQDMIDGTLKVWKAFAGNKLKLIRKAGGEVTYHVPLALWEDLKQHVAETEKTPDSLLFCHTDGQPLGEGRLYKIWKKACADAKVKYIPIQQASRHSMASRMMKEAKEEALRQIAIQLGNRKDVARKHYVRE